MKKILKLIVILLNSLLFVNAMAQQAMTPEEQAQVAVEVRQSVFKLLNANMGPIGGMARGRIPFDAALAQKHSERIAQLGAMITDVFEMDTREFDVETLALNKIWDNKEDFAKHAADLVEKARAFSVAAQSGDMATTMKELRPLGSACGNCHDNYRMDKD